MKLTAVQTFTDRSGQEHKQNESFECRDNQEAQEYIRNGQAKAAEGSGSTSGSGGGRGGSETK